MKKQSIPKKNSMQGLKAQALTAAIPDLQMLLLPCISYVRLPKLCILPKTLAFPSAKWQQQ